MRGARLLYVDMAIIAVLLLNMLDGAFTLVWVQTGIGVEANPFMEVALSKGPLYFMPAKLALVSLGVFLMFRFREKLFARVGLTVCLIAYVWIFVHHMQGVPHLLG